MKLYEFNAAVEDLFGEIVADSDDGELTPEQVEAVNNLMSDFKEKVGRCAAYIRNLESQAAASKDEAARLSGRAKTLQNKADGMKQYVMDCMASLGEDKVVGELFTVSIRTGPPGVVVIDDSLLPAHLAEVRSTIHPDKKAIKLGLCQGEVINGAELRPGKQYLSIR